MNNKTIEGWEGFVFGMIFAVIIIFLVNWLVIDKKDDDWWCIYLSGSEVRHCQNLYEKAVRNIDKRYSEEPECVPNYMGGCD